MFLYTYEKTIYKYNISYILYNNANVCIWILDYKK